jgi:hypothetical protein
MSGKSNIIVGESLVRRGSVAVGLLIGLRVRADGIDRPHLGQRHFSLQKAQKCNFFQCAKHICNDRCQNTTSTESNSSGELNNDGAFTRPNTPVVISQLPLSDAAT